MSLEFLPLQYLSGPLPGLSFISILSFLGLFSPVPFLHCILFLPGTPSLHLGSRSNLDPWFSSFFLSIPFIHTYPVSTLPPGRTPPTLPVPSGLTDLSSPPRTPPANIFFAHYRRTLT
ncbi:hypothetical protein FPOAC2_03259 [Fusarium poae]